MIAANSDSIIHAVMNLGVLTGASRLSDYHISMYRWSLLIGNLLLNVFFNFFYVLSNRGGS